MKDAFVVNSIIYEYNELRTEFLNHPVNTCFRSVELSKDPLTIGQSCCTYYAEKYLNKLPNHLKNKVCSKKPLKIKVKEFDLNESK